MIVAPSLLSANVARLEDEINSVQAAGAKYLHIDVMDGHFVPNLSFGPCIVEGIRRNTNIFFDVHLMLENPEQFVIPFILSGANAITVHIEATQKIQEIRNECKKKNINFGISICPNTTVESIQKYMQDIDILLVMGIVPGFGGQKLIPETPDKVKEAVKWRKIMHAHYLISVDGGVNALNASTLWDAGADVLVAGSAVFGKADRSAAIKDIINSKKVTYSLEK
jgi:ribulose-phosphate 3-epimerase